MAGAAIGVSLVGCLVILASTLGLDVPGGSVGVVGRFADAEQRTPLEVPIAVFVLAAVGLAVGAATLAAASVRSGGKAVGLLVFGIGIAIAGLGGLALGSLDALRVSARAIMGDEGLIVPAWHLTGLISLASAVAIVLLLVARPRGRRVLLPVAAAAPFLALLVGLLLAIGHEIPVGTFNQALAPDYPATLSIGAPIHGPILFFVGLTGGLIGLLAIWQTSTWTRASARQVGRHLGRQTRRWWWLLGGLLGAKLVWLALGIGGLLPPMLGGASGAWAALRSDDVASFLYVAVLVGVAGLWLLRPRRSLPESRALRWAGVVIALIAAATLITTAVPLLVPALESLEPSGRTTSIPGDVTLGACLSTWSRPAGTLLSCLGLWIPDWQNLWILAVLLVAFVAGLALIRRRPTDGSAIFLVVLGAWGLPRGLQAASAVPPPELPGVADLPSFNAPQPETLDLAVTVLVLGLAIGWWMDRQRRVEPADLVIILVVSTLVIHGSTLVPTSPLPLLLAAAIIFPILYELVFDSKELNDPSREDRAARVLASTGSRALALTLLAVTLASGVVDIDSLTGRFAFIVFGLPFAITIVAVTISDRHALGRVGDASEIGGRGGRARPIGALAGGAALVLLLSVAAAAATPAMRWLYPTPVDRLAELEARIGPAVERATGLLETTDDPTLLSEGLDLLYRQEEDWLRNHDPHPCAATAWTVWRDYAADLREYGLVLVAVENVPSDARPEDLQAFSRHAAEVGPTLELRGDALQKSITQAQVDCADPR